MFKSLLPSYRIKDDIDFSYNQIGSIKPIELDLKVTFPMKNKIMGLRKKNQRLSIEKTQKKTSLIIPFRNREENIKIFLPFIRKYLENQRIDYEIIVVEQKDNQPFNKAKLLNIGAIHSRDESEYFIFHDVDILPENIDYRYCNHTEKLFYKIKHPEEFNYAIWTSHALGGATLVPKTIFYEINGWSNHYWQWGREDDDFFVRHLLKGFVPLYDENGKFEALDHELSYRLDNNGRLADEQMVKKNQRMFRDNEKNLSRLKRGISSQDLDGISTLAKYKVNSIHQQFGVKFLDVFFYDIEKN